jgi:hypothetical protein
MSERGKQNVRNRRRRLELLAICARCSYCGRMLTFRKSTIDHIVARVWGGKEDPDNTCLACRACNRAKSCDPIQLFVSPRVPGARRLFYASQVRFQEKGKTMSSQIVGFNYEVLDKNAGTEAREHAQQIRLSLERTSAAIVEIGRRLIAVRAALGDERYRAWLIAEFQWNTACALTYETVAQKFGELKCIDRFHPSALYSLSRTNTDERAVKEAIKHAEKGKTVTRDVAVQAIRKFLPAPPARPAIALQRPAETRRPAIAAESMPATPDKLGLASFRAFIRQLDVTEIPAEDRAQLANELLELAMQLRTGRMQDGSPVARKPAAKDAKAERPRAARRELARA